MSFCLPLINSMKVSLALFSVSLPYFRAGVFGLLKTSLEIFWFKDYILILPLPNFSSLVILVTAYWTFETRNLRCSNQCSFSLWPIVSFSMVWIVSLKSLISLNKLIASDMLRIFLGWIIFVEMRSLARFTFALGNAVFNILWGELCWFLLQDSSYSIVLNHSFTMGQISFLTKVLMVSFFISG